jgi:hypothetical protein
MRGDIVIRPQTRWIQGALELLINKAFSGNINSKGVLKLKNNTGLYVAGLGAAVTGIGAAVLSGPLAAGAIGFGLAHIVLGLADTARPSVRS